MDEPLTEYQQKIAASFVQGYLHDRNNVTIRDYSRARLLGDAYARKH
jgi:hypothetical protein